MSIIKPHRERRFLWFLVALVALSAIAGATYVASYRSFADARHEVERLRKEVISLEATHVDLTERAVVATDPEALEALARVQHLSLDGHPTFLTVRSVR